MHLASNRPSIYHNVTFIAVLAIVFCLECANSAQAASAGAALKSFSSPSAGERTVGLKLDLGPAMADDDCEEDYADLMDAATTTGERAKPAAQRPATPPAAPAAAGTAAQAAIPPANAAGPVNPANPASPGANPAFNSAFNPAAMAAQGAQAAPATPAAAPVPVAPPAPAWEVTLADKTLNAVLARWAATAGWQLVWELPVDYAVSVRTELHGTFTEAVGLVAKSMSNAEIPMKAIFYDGNRVLRIVAKGSE
jgi:hypothetical protein